MGAIGYVRHTDVERFSAEDRVLAGRGLLAQGHRHGSADPRQRYVFEQVNMLRLFALPFADNPGSVRVLEKAGYVREAILQSSRCRYGQPRDQALYARLNPRWRGIDG